MEQEKELIQVSIPSRRVGDTILTLTSVFQVSVSIPSRRVGYIKPIVVPVSASNVSIPSRRVGDLRGRRLELQMDEVSIPSRRVGDQGKMRGKAGKRRQKGGRVAVDLRYAENHRGVDGK